MTKKEIVRELHKHGELWASEMYNKQYLQEQLDATIQARSMTNEELFAKLMGKGQEVDR